MASSFTNLITASFGAVREVERELNGLVRAVDTDFADKGVAKDQTLSLPITVAATNSAFTPAATTSSGTDVTPTTVDITITKSQKNSFNINPEQKKGIENSGTRAMEWVQGQLKQHMRALANELEDDLAALYTESAYAVGTGGTTPFASNFDILPDARRLLVNVNGAPQDGLQCVVDGLAAANIRKLGVLTKANEAGTDATLRRGELLDISGFGIYESSRIDTHTNSGGSGYLINNGSGEAVGQTVLTVDTGSGDFAAGDVFAHASDSTNKYVASGAISAGDLTINDGLLVAAADNDALTHTASYVANMCFHKSAIKAAVRPPLMNAVPGAKQQLVTDPHTGLTFLVMEIEQYGQTSVEVHLAWGVAVTHPEWLVLAMG